MIKELYKINIVNQYIIEYPQYSQKKRIISLFYYNLSFFIPPLHPFYSSKINTSSIVMPKYTAMLWASIIDGLYLPFSRELMVCRETPMALASSSWRMPRSVLISSILFFTLIPRKRKVNFTHIIAPIFCMSS